MSQIGKFSNEIIMKKIVVTTGDNCNPQIIGDNNTFSNSFNSVNEEKNDKLLELLMLMSQEIERLKVHLLHQDYQDLNSDYKSLVEENKNENPRKERNRIFIESIKDIVLKVGAIGTPLLGIVERIMSLIK